MCNSEDESMEITHEYGPLHMETLVLSGQCTRGFPKGTRSGEKTEGLCTTPVAVVPSDRALSCCCHFDEVKSGASFIRHKAN